MTAHCDNSRAAHSPAARWPGRLIVFEGIDGTGKTTQAALLKRTLEARGFVCAMLREPTDGPYGRRLRELAAAGRDEVSREEEAELFRRDRMEDVERNILPALRRGEIVLLDRYYFSTMAYQGALGLDVEQIRREHEAFAPQPDLALYFDIEPARAAERIRHGRGEAPNLFERVEYLDQVRAIYRTMRFPYWRTVDASQSAETVRKAVLSAVEPILPA